MARSSTLRFRVPAGDAGLGRRHISSGAQCGPWRLRRVDRLPKRRDLMNKSTLPSARLAAAEVQPLRAQIMPTATCHLWMGSLGSDGYGKFSISAPTTFVNEPATDHAGLRHGCGWPLPHAAVSALVFGALPLGSAHLHDCDLRLCVTPSLGTCDAVLNGKYAAGRRPRAPTRPKARHGRRARPGRRLPRHLERDPRGADTRTYFTVDVAV